jgi:hypothetical protein
MYNTKFRLIYRGSVTSCNRYQQVPLSLVLDVSCDCGDNATLTFFQQVLCSGSEEYGFGIGQKMGMDFVSLTLLERERLRDYAGHSHLCTEIISYCSQLTLHDVVARYISAGVQVIGGNLKGHWALLKEDHP